MKLKLEEIAGVRLDRELYRSPHSFVYLGEDGSGNRRVVKVYFDFNNFPDLTLESRFEREVSALEHFADDHRVPTLFGYGEISGERFNGVDIRKAFYAVMEFFDGNSLFSNIPILVNVGPDEFRCYDGRAEVVRVSSNKDYFDEDYIIHAISLIDLVEVLKDLHERKLTHGDLKPNNILIGEQGLMVLDFEYSEIEGRRYQTKHTNFGQIGYQDPDYDASVPRSYGYDMFSVGCLINDLFPFKFYRDEKLEDFLQRSLYLTEMFGWNTFTSYVFDYARMAKDDPERFKARIKGNERLQKGLLRDFVSNLNQFIPHLMNPFNPESYDVCRIREFRNFIYDIFSYRPELGGVNRVMQIDAVKEMMDLGRNLILQDSSSRMSAPELYQNLRNVKKELIKYLSSPSAP